MIRSSSKEKCPPCAALALPAPFIPGKLARFAARKILALTVA
jgi:hypothetical protein